jgi:primosomal protein N' (replication factor Y)
MQAQVLVLQGAAWGEHRHAPLFVYAVPPDMREQIQPGQLVLIPFGARLASGIVWETQPHPPAPSPTKSERGRSAFDRVDQHGSPDARPPLSISDGEQGSRRVPVEEDSRGATGGPGVQAAPQEVSLANGAAASPAASRMGPLRAIRAIIDPVPLLDATRRALAAWLAAYYVCPLVDVVRLLAPGMTGKQQIDLIGASPADLPLPMAEDDPQARALLGLLAAGGRADEADVRRALGPRRADALIAALEARGALARIAHATVPRPHATLPMLRLVADPDTVAAWRAATLAVLTAAASFPQSWGMQRAPQGNGEDRGAPVAGSAVPRPYSARRQPVTSRAGRRSRGALLQRIATAGASPAAPLVAPLAARDLVRLRAAVAVVDLLSATPERVRPQREVMRLTRATPAALRIVLEAGLVTEENAEDAAEASEESNSTPLDLTPPQRAALDRIVAALDAATEVATQEATDGTADAHLRDAARPLLLHGITGSGKTEVYLQALAAALARGRRGIVLVPEIALTPQTVSRFAARFPGRVALLHSALRPAERQRVWRRIRSGAVDVVIGSRSAIFAPLPDLGLIILDEEHDGSYKEDNRPPTYHAREVALALARLTGSAVVLGSATPATESYQRAQAGEFALLELRERPNPQPLPPVTVVDLREELHAGHTSILSRALLAELGATLARGEQAILFLNRRGSATCVLCRDCGHAMRCGRCDVPLTHHQGQAKLICHYCNWRETPPQRCPRCGGDGMRFFGVGTERVEATVRQHFPAARVLRWDADTVRGYADHARFAHALAEREVDLLIGTQMIAKGLDVPGVTLVGIIAADVALYLPDYRASERAFQVLTQVAGRAGRATLPGRVIMQTFSPDHYCIEAAARHDYSAFYEVEIATRQAFGYPPFRRFVKLTYTHKDRHACQVEAISLGDHLARLIDDLVLADTDIVGPAPAFIERLREHYRWQMILRGPDPRAVIAALAPGELGAGWTIDIDPTSSL